MLTTATPTPPRPDRTWDSPARSPVLERFYRELMGVDQLPSVPEIAQQMLLAINREQAAATEIAALIARDQALAARLLRLANSAFFAIQTKVTSIPHAVTLLGFTRVRDLVLGLSVWGALEGSSAGARRYRRLMWTHSAAVAATARALAEAARGDGATAFSAGLLHDVGKLVLGLRLGDTYWELLDAARARGESAEAVEREAFGCHHGTVGGWLLQLWRLPPTLVDPVAMHHDPLAPDLGRDAPALVAVANRLVEATDPASGDVPPDLLAQIDAALPGLLDAARWREIHAGLAGAQQAIAGVLD
jgi:putative nucleotidyltransferase with HDIG domain